MAHQNIVFPNNNVKHMGDQDESPDQDGPKGKSVTVTTHHSTRGPCKQHRHHQQHQTNRRGSAHAIEVRPGVGQTHARNNTWSGLEQMTPCRHAAPAGPAYIHHGWMQHSKWTIQDHRYARHHPQMDLGLRGCYSKLLSLEGVCWNGYEWAEAQWMIGNKGLGYISP